MPKENLIFEVHRTEPVGNVVRINDKTRKNRKSITERNRLFGDTNYRDVHGICLGKL